MKVLRHNRGDCPVMHPCWIVTGDPLPPPSGPRFMSPLAHAYYVTGWSESVANGLTVPLDPTPTKGGE